MRWTCFEKRNFMGIELDVLVGHPEHELLFVATQVARAAGLKSPHYSASVCASAVGHKEARQLGTLEIPKTLIPKAMQGSSWFFTESTIYRMLMRGSTEKAKAFQTWLAEEVLPTIRKTGSYNAAESSNPIAVGIMDELKLLRGELVELKEIVKALVYWT
mgnify:CR=1 FL=1